MGLWQGFKDSKWLFECAVRITQHAPQHTISAKELCSEFKDHLLGLRSLGKTPHEAILDTCILLINGISEGLADKQPSMTNHLMVAYQTGYGFLNKWPNSGVEDDYSIRMFRFMAKVDPNIWNSPLAEKMSSVLEADEQRFSRN